MGKKRKFEIARPPSMTKLAPRRVHTVRSRGGNTKFRALRLDTGSYSWGSEAITKSTRVIDAAPFRNWYEAHYALPLGRKKGTKLTDAEDKVINKKRSAKCEKKYKERQKESKVEPAL